MDLIRWPETEDRDLLDRMKKDDRKAFQVLFNKYWPTAYNKAYRKLKDPVLAKDIVQDIFVQIWMHRHQMISNFAGYLHVSVSNRVLQTFRAKKNKETFVDPANTIFEDLQYRDSTALQRKEFYHSFERLVASLPPKRQEIFRLRYTEELNTREIASKMGLTQKTVQNQLGKAVDKLRGRLLQLVMLSEFFYVLN